MPAEPDADALRLRSAALAEQAADVREAVTNTLAEREVALTVSRQRAERAMEALEHQLDGAGELMIQSIGAAEESAARADHLGELVDKALLEGNEQLARDLSNESALARQQATSYSAQADAAEQDFVRLKDEIVEQRARTTEIDLEAVQLHSQQAESFLALDDLDARAAVYAEAAERQQQFEAMNAEPLPDDDSANRILLERWEVQAQAGQLMEAADAMVVNPAALLDVAPGLDLDPAVVLAAPCCHHDLQAQIARTTAPSPYTLVTRYGLLRERFVDILTDTVRASLLKFVGYRVDAVQFVSDEHTNRNLMLRAVRTGARPSREELADYDRLVGDWGVVPALATRLASELERARA